MAKSQQDQVYSCRKMDAEFPGSVADGLFRERVPEISHQKEALQDITVLSNGIGGAQLMLH